MVFITATQKLRPINSKLHSQVCSIPLGISLVNKLKWKQLLPYQPNVGWLVCDGGDDLHGGNVPDLRDRFVKGVSDTNLAGEIGGSSDITVDSTTLAVEQIPSHNHPYVDFRYLAPSTMLYSGNGGYSTANASQITDNAGGSQSHTHSFSGIVNPPYYSLIYFVKLPKQ